MNRKRRKVDAIGRVSLPESFANCTVVLEGISDTELRIRKVVDATKEEVRFIEESSMPLTDREAFLHLLDNPPPASAALKTAAERAGYPND